MCGIVAVLRRRSDARRPAPRPTSRPHSTGPRRSPARPRLDGADAIDALGAPRSPSSPRSTGRCAASPGSKRCSATASRWSASNTAPKRSQRTLGRVEAHLDAEVAAALVDDVEALNAALVAAKDAAVGDRARSAARGACGRQTSPGGVPPSIAGPRDLRLDPGRAVGDRPARGARPRLGRPARVRRRATASTSTDPGIAARLIEARRDPLFVGRFGAGDPAATSRSSTRPRPRSVSSATTPRRCGRRSATTTCCASRCVRRRAGGRARPHALGERRHHLRSATRTRSNHEELGADARAVRDRRAERRRRQLRRPEGARSARSRRPRSPPTRR